MTQLLMPKATAVWLVDNTALSFEQIAAFCTLHPLEVKAIADGEARGFVKVITPKGKDKVLGATIVGYHASELINEFISTMNRGGRLKDIMSTIHIYPTWGEANKFAAGEWSKAHKPEKLLSYVEKFHRWRLN